MTNKTAIAITLYYFYITGIYKRFYFGPNFFLYLLIAMERVSLKRVNEAADIGICVYKGISSQIIVYRSVLWLCDRKMRFLLVVFQQHLVVILRMMFQ